MELIKQIDETVSFNEKNIRVIGSYEEPWFVAKDICNILELPNITNAIKILPEKWRGLKLLNTFGGDQNMIIINEAGLYKLIMRSNKPIAQKFQEVVCEEILPSLRKKGEYKMQSLIDRNEELEEEQLRIEEEKNKLEEEHKKSVDEIEKLNKQLHKRYEPRIITEEKFVIYLLVAYINGKTIYIIGKTADITKRYRLKGILMHEEDIKLAYYKSCRSSIILNQVESCVILNMSEYIVEGTREVFETTELNETEMLDNFKKIIDFYVDSFKHISPHITICNRDIKEEARIRTELYVEENREEINEKVREDRIENPEKFQEREKKRDPEKKKEKNKRYNEKHKEEISEYNAEYREKNAEIISERRKKKYQSITEEEKEKNAQKAKEYRENNKIKRKETSTQKVKCLVCSSIFSRQCWKRHTTSLFHTNALKLNSNLSEKFEIIIEEVELQDTNLIL